VVLTEPLPTLRYDANSILLGRVQLAQRPCQLPRWERRRQDYFEGVRGKSLLKDGSKGLPHELLAVKHRDYSANEWTIGRIFRPVLYRVGGRSISIAGDGKRSGNYPPLSKLDSRSLTGMTPRR
jgi:hypothetical protein